MKKLYFLFGPRPKGLLSGANMRGIRHWEIEGNQAKLLSKSAPVVELTDPDNDQVVAAQLRDQLSEKIDNRHLWKLYKSPVAGNQFYPRIFRPTFTAPTGGDTMLGRMGSSFTCPSMDTTAFEEAGFQLTALIASMMRIFSVLNPSPDNLHAYGVEIRNLLIVASTEFEAQCKSVLRANGYTRSRMSTNDYIRLLSAMRLNEYSVRVSPFSQMEPFKPFQDWDRDAPTRSLAWYDAYNKTKHDRENEFAAATLEAAVSAVGACAIMSYAQFGTLPNSDVGSSTWFSIRDKPKWLSFRSYTQVGHSSSAWESVNYPFV